MRIVKFLLAIFFPPLSVLLHTGIGLQLLINIVLTIIGIIPGIIHALWLLTTHGPATTPVHA